ncbi:hypothetical protein GN958_ATG07137 [Phytophthora infestans]|uniref:RxLR effector protein n=1 Tax=Phytophthora infestans TaxID=4787 RepID=A0A8S9UWR9_PHYIN|nr:hypothetical protein GN958_ATG07137 [Phytophthora infestans]
MRSAMCQFAILVLLVAIAFSRGGALPTLSDAEKSKSSNMDNLSSFHGQHKSENHLPLRVTKVADKITPQDLDHDDTAERVLHISNSFGKIIGKLFYYKTWFKEGKTPEEMRVKLRVLTDRRHRNLYHGYADYWF